MRIELSPQVEVRLRTLAERQGRDVCALAEEAVRQYLDAAAITDVGPTEAAAAQDALLAELPRTADWQSDDA